MRRLAFALASTFLHEGVLPITDENLTNTFLHTVKLSGKTKLTLTII
jgi:hypothetical protein